MFGKSKSLLFLGLLAPFYCNGQSSISAEQADRVSERPVNLLTDCSHDYSFKLSWAERNQKEIFKGINCLTSGRTIHKLDLENINALVLLTHSRLPYHPKDAQHVLDYVKKGGGLYLSVKPVGEYNDSLNAFLKKFGLELGTYLSKNKENWGISAHAPSELIFEINRKYKRFTAKVGVWADCRGTVGFEVYGDNRLIYKSKVLTGTERENIDISIEGVTTLRLVANDGGDGKSFDGSIWFDPRITNEKGEQERLLLRDAVKVKTGWSMATQDMHFNGKSLGAAKASNAKDENNEDIIASDHPAAYQGITLSPKNIVFLKVLDPAEWETVFTKGNLVPIVLSRKYGKGIIIADMSGIYYGANEESKPHIQAMKKIIDYMSRGKSVSSIKGGGGWQFSDGYRWDLIKDTPSGLRIYYNEYTKMYINNDIKAYKKTVEYLTKITGLDEKDKADQIKEYNALKASRFLGTAIDVDISGIKELTLISTDGGDGKNADHSVWADAFLINNSGKKKKLIFKDASEIKPGYAKATFDSHEGVPLSIGGKKYETGIYIHAPGKIVLKTDGKYKRFSAHAGCQDSFRGSVGFKILGDNKILWDNNKIYFGGVPGKNRNDVNYIPEGTLFQIKYLACEGAGFLLPQGAAVDLAPGLKDDWQVHLGMFSHEMGHAWSFPFCEKIGEEGSAFIFNNLVLHHHNGQKHEDSATKRLAGYLKKKDLDNHDLASSPNNFKNYIFIDLMIREYGEDIWKNYNLLKYAILCKEGAKWDPHSTAWLWSIASGQDMFPFFNNAFASTMKKNKVVLPKKLINAGFDPVKVGKLYNIPLKKLKPKRNILNKMKNFGDVRNFYEKEIKEKGHPKVEG